MEQLSDKHLMKRYAAERSDAAFTKLVERHIELVYATCYRELHQRELAEEATQAVFLALARSLHAIRSEAALVSWLYTTARHQASHLRRQEQRHMAREQAAVEEATRRYDRSEEEAWSGIEPALNDALSALSVPDRQAILLRFFEGKSLREVGQAMGSSEDAARMRVARALEKLRSALASRKAAAISAVALATLLTKHATYAVPAHLPASVAQSAGPMFSLPSVPPLLGAGGPGSALNPLLAKGLLVMSTQKIIAGAFALVLLLLLLGIGVHKLRSPGTGSSMNPAIGVQPSGQPGQISTTQGSADRAARAADARSLVQVTKAILNYANSNGRYPDADRWMDEIGLNGSGSSNHYVYNKNLSGLPVSAMKHPSSTILCFDSAASAKNASDTGQSIPNAGVFGGGVNISFTDGHIKWLKVDAIRQISAPTPNDGVLPSFRP